MKRIKLLLAFFSIVLMISFYISWLLWSQNSRSVFNQIEKSVREIDSNYHEILHVDINQKHNLVFYITNKEEIGVVTLERAFTGFKLKSYINKNPFFADQDISWQGTDKQDEDIHLIYGKVENPETSQIIIVSEENQPANIIRNGTRIMWYFLTDEQLHLPVTLQTFNSEGKKLYETGDVNYWNNT